jgi:branched-chain amino acid transport system ATP-binding protein
MKREVTVLLVEQNLALAEAVGDDFVLLDDGRTVQAGSMTALATDAALKQRYLGV